jgi:polygalacturonase
MKFLVYLMVVTVILLELLIPTSTASRRINSECLVTKFGALCDGTTDDTLSIQQTISTCNKVIFPSNQTCLSQPLILRSNTWLYISPNATLKAGKRWNDTTFISATNSLNITITSEEHGKIDGSGKQWWNGSNKTPGRPRLLVLENCVHVHIEGLTIINPPAWTTSFSGADYKLYNITIISPPYKIAPNTDGIDLAVHGAHIKNCVIQNGDDSICMKSPSHNVLVENSIVKQGNGFVIGTSSNANFSNITFRNCTAESTHYGIHIKFKDNQTGQVNNVLFDNINIKDPLFYPIGINMNGQEIDGDQKHMVQSSVIVSNITFSNIISTGGLSAGYFNCNPGKLACCGITLSNVHLENTLMGCKLRNVFGRATNVSPKSCILQQPP